MLNSFHAYLILLSVTTKLHVGRLRPREENFPEQVCGKVEYSWGVGVSLRLGGTQSWGFKLWLREGECRYKLWRESDQRRP